VGAAATLAGPGVITQNAGHTIEGGGGGTISAALINAGLITANDFDDTTNGGVLDSTLALTGATIVNSGTMSSTGSGELSLQGNKITNDALIQSTGGLVDLTGATVTQATGGELEANGGEVQFDSNTTVTGGSLGSTGTSSFLVNTGATFASLTSAALVDIAGNATLNVTGNLVDNGTLLVSMGGSQNAEIDFSGTTLSGTGNIDLNNVGVAAQVDGTVTQDAGHTISGYGEITANLTNYGLVDGNASGQVLYLALDNMTNDAEIEGSANGTICVIGVTITQSAAGELVTNGGTVEFVGATISGGALNTTAAGGVFIDSGAATFSSVTNNALVGVPGSSTLNVNGTLTNNGTILISIGGSSNAVISFSGAQLSGTGDIVLNDAGAYAQLNGTLTQEAGHTINGYGEINATMTNDGTVDAATSGEAIVVNGPMANAGLVEASNGGTLSFATGALTNTGLAEASGSGTVTFAAGELTNFSGTTLTGGTYEALASGTLSLSGTVATNNAAVILNGRGASFSAINGITANEGSFSVYGGFAFVTKGNLSNTGTLTTGTASELTVNGTLTQSSPGSLTGSGTFAAVTFSLGGTVAPGGASGPLTLDGTTVFQSTLQLAWALGGVNGASNSHLDISGPFTLAGTLDVTALSGFGPGLYDLIDYGNGTFTNDTLHIGSSVPGGFNYTLETGTPGQVDLLVVASAIPEPGTLGMMLAGIGMFGVLQRYRRRR